jgi:hypothetical protein
MWIACAYGEGLLARIGTRARELSAALGLIVAATPVRAGAQAAKPAEAELSWVRAGGAESCADARAMRAAVTRRLGRDPFGTTGAISVEAQATREGQAWIARIRALGPDGELLGARTLRSDAADCGSLGEAAALAVALVIDPDAVARVASAQPPPAALPPAAPPPAATGVPRDGPPAWLDARAALSSGLLPGAAPGFVLGAQLPIVQWLSTAFDLRFFPEQETSAEGARYAFGLSAAALGLCIEALQQPALGLSLCGLGQLGAIHAVVYDLQPTAPGDRLWAAASAKLQLHVPIGRVRLALAGLLTAPFTRHAFKASGRDDTIFRQPAIAFGGELGVGLRF